MKEYYCSVCGRKHNGKYSSSYCRKHKYQIDKYGKILDSNPRTKYDPNEFRFVDGHVEFDTYCYPSQEVVKTYIIDAEDYPRVSKLKWHTLSTGYAYCKDSKVLLHRFIMNCRPGQEVDHINLNILDNRKANLRYCTSRLNKLNMSPKNITGVKGVTIHRDGRYSTCIIIGGKQFHSPCYSTLEEAAFARYILEQMFVKEVLYQHNSDMFMKLTEEVKASIIKGLKMKFNKE